MAAKGTILEKSEAIFKKLNEAKHVEVEGVDPSLHYLAPYVPKPDWTELGDLIA